MNPIQTLFFLLCCTCTVIPLIETRVRIGSPLTILTSPHYLCMRLSQVRSLQFSSCRLFMFYIFIFHSFVFCYINKAVRFLVWIVLHCHIRAFYSWPCGMGITHCWRPYGDLYLLMSLSFWSLVDCCLIGNHTTSSFLYSCPFKMPIIDI